MNNKTKNKLIPDLRFPEFVNEGEWSKKKLGDVADIVTGNTPSTIEPANYNGNNLFVSPYDINDSRYVSQTKTTLSDLGFSKTRQIQTNSVLFVCIGSTIGKVAQNKFKCATNQQINSLIANEGNSSDFLYSILDFNSKQIASIAGNHAVPIINKTSFSAIELSFPPNFREQQKIASCLSSLDEVIAAHSQKLEALKEHKKGLMQNLFPQEGETVPKLRFPEFLGDGDWVETNLEEVSEIGRGKSKHRPRDAAFLYGGNFPFIQTGDIKKAGLYLTKYSQTYSAEGLKQSKLWEEDTLCITIAANIAETAILKIKACFPDSVIGIVPKKNKASVVFIKFMFDKYKGQLQSLAQGLAQDNLNQEKLSKIKFSFPSLPEQQKIANCFESLEGSMVLQAEKIEHLKLHKKGLMQGLFPNVID